MLKPTRAADVLSTNIEGNTEDMPDQRGPDPWTAAPLITSAS